MTTTELAKLIIEGAHEAGYTYEQISRWTMERGDCDLVRGDMPGASSEDVQARIDAVSEDVRTLASEYAQDRVAL